MLRHVSRRIEVVLRSRRLHRRHEHLSEVSAIDGRLLESEEDAVPYVVVLGKVLENGRPDLNRRHALGDRFNKRAHGARLTILLSEVTAA